MKRIQTLCQSPPGLADYLALEIDGIKDWAGFRSHEAGASYTELVQTLVDIQHGLCGYCEINIEELDRQVEHLIPQSDPLRGARHALDHGNLIACCKGGTLRTDDQMRRLDPVKRNRSCGQAKDDTVDADLIDPRTLPTQPSLTRVNFDGRIEGDAACCESCGIDIDRVERTIQILGLNAERLRRAREDRWNALSDTWADDLGDPDIMEAAALEELLPDARNRLARFFTTSRSYFGVYGEDVLLNSPQSWI